MLQVQEGLELLRQQFGNIDTIQCLVLVLGITEVLLARANNIGLYPTGIAATTLGIYSLFQAQLYAECLLHLYYIVMSVYGWWYWTTRKNMPAVPVSFTTRREWAVTFGIVGVGFVMLYCILVTFTPSAVPVWDAWVSATAWAGMWLLARRKVENWVLLNLSNAFAIPLLLNKALPLFAVLTAFLFIVACKGYYDWFRIARKGHMQVSEC